MVLEPALKQYQILVKGNTIYTSIAFHVFTGILIGCIMFFILNISGKEFVEQYARIYYDSSHIVMLDPKFFGVTAPVPVAYKIIEFLSLILLSIILTAIASTIMRQRSLDDALSSIRTSMLGEWELELLNFADDGGADRHFRCKVRIGVTEARKLWMQFFDSSELHLKGKTALVALYVPEQGPKPSEINIAFPIEGGVKQDGEPGSMLYWTKLSYIAWQGNKNNKQENKLSFTGDWYRVMLNGQKFRETGEAKMKLTSI